MVFFCFMCFLGVVFTCWDTLIFFGSNFVLTRLVFICSLCGFWVVYESLNSMAISFITVAKFTSSIIFFVFFLVVVLVVRKGFVCPPDVFCSFLSCRMLAFPVLLFTPLHLPVAKSELPFFWLFLLQKPLCHFRSRVHLSPCAAVSALPPDHGLVSTDLGWVYSSWWWLESNCRPAASSLFWLFCSFCQTALAYCECLWQEHEWLLTGIWCFFPFLLTVTLKSGHSVASGSVDGMASVYFICFPDCSVLFVEGRWGHTNPGTCCQAC